MNREKEKRAIEYLKAFEPETEHYKEAEWSKDGSGEKEYRKNTPGV